jgi:hypothetical protein
LLDGAIFNCIEFAKEPNKLSAEGVIYQVHFRPRPFVAIQLQIHEDFRVVVKFGLGGAHKEADDPSKIHLLALPDESLALGGELLGRGDPRFSPRAFELSKLSKLRLEKLYGCILQGADSLGLSCLSDATPFEFAL